MLDNQNSHMLTHPPPPHPTLQQKLQNKKQKNATTYSEIFERSWI